MTSKFSNAVKRERERWKDRSKKGLIVLFHLSLLSFNVLFFLLVHEKVLTDKKPKVCTNGSSSFSQKIQLLKCLISPPAFIL